MEVVPVLALLLLSRFAVCSSSPASNSSSQLFPSSTPPSSHLSSPVDGSSVSVPPTPNVPSPYDVSPRFNPSMAIIIVVLLSAFFFMGFFSVYVRRCTAEDEFDPSPNHGGGSGNVFLLGAAPRRQDRPPQGLDLVLVNNLPLVRFSALKRRKDTECVVCLNDFEDGEALRLLPKCGHLFHRECIDMWLFSHTTCPLCRRGLVHDKNGSASLTRMAEEGNQSSRIDGGNVPVPVAPAPAAEVAIDIDDSTPGVDDEQGTHASGSAESDLLPEEDLDAGFSQCGSPILGVMETPTGSTRQICNGTGRELRRSHSTGHFLLRGARDRMSKPIASPSSELFLAIASSIHRTRSYTMLSDLESAQEEEQQDGADGWRFSFRRLKREASEPNLPSCTDPSSSSKGANIAKSSSPSWRTFKRLTGIERSVHREFAQLAYVL